MMNIRSNKLSIKLMAVMVMALLCVAAWGAVSYAASSSATATGYIDADDGVNLRKGASIASSKVAGLADNTKVIIKKEIYTSLISTKAEKRWYYVQAGAYTGYVRADLVDNVKYGNSKTGKTTDALNYRRGPVVTMEKKGVLDKGAKVTVLVPAKFRGMSENWYKVKIDGKYYFVSGDYVKMTNAKSTTSSGAKTSTKKTGSTSTSKTDKTKSSSSSKTVSKTEPKDVKTVWGDSSISHPIALGKGSSFTLCGSISCNKTIDKAIVGITNNKGVYEIKKTVTVGSDTFNIGTVDKDIKFGTLPEGTHTLKVFLYVDGKCSKKLSYKFEIKDVSGPELLANTAITLAWPVGTPASKYSYGTGSRTQAYKNAMNEVFPVRRNWGKYPKVGVSCDVFIATVCRYSGYDKTMTKSLGSMWSAFKDTSKWNRVNYNYRESDLQSGDIFIYKRKNGNAHVCMYVVVNGKGYVAEASFTRHLYGYLNPSLSKILKKSDKKTLYVYRACK